ncbi:hypothetical protein N9W89_00970 [Hellea sp.]|nr:hypothetical protein [Hellea sp.]
MKNLLIALLVFGFAGTATSALAQSNPYQAVKDKEFDDLAKKAIEMEKKAKAKRDKETKKKIEEDRKKRNGKGFPIKKKKTGAVTIK